MCKAAVFRWGISYLFLEGNAKAVFTLEPAGISYILYCSICGFKVINCLLEAYRRQVAVRCHTGFFFEAADKVRKIEGNVAGNMVLCQDLVQVKMRFSSS